MKSNITLIGMMGSGKTTTGEELRKLLPDFHYVDIDAEIEKSTQKKFQKFFSDMANLFSECSNQKRLKNSAKKRII